MAKLRIDNKTDIKKALDAALLCGFMAESALFPVINPGDEIDVPDDISASPLPENYTPARKTGPLWQTDFRNKKGLENMLSEGMFLTDTDNDFLPDRIDVKIALAEISDEYVLCAACNLAYRFGMETTGIEGSIYADDNYNGKLIYFTGENAPEIILEDNGNVKINGHGGELLTFISSLCNTFPKLDAFYTWRDELMKMTDDLAFRSIDGQFAYANSLGGNRTLYHTPDKESHTSDHFTESSIKAIPYNTPKEVWSKEFTYEWEADEFVRIFEENVLFQLNRGDTIYVEGALSEDKDVRADVRSKIIRSAFSKGVNVEETQIVCAYKQGFSWIDEVVIPQLRCFVTDKMTIYFKPYLAPGEIEWRDENGATPSYNSAGGGSEDKWLDLPIRYLQELYPIEDVIANQLKIHRDNIVFALLDTDEDITYAVEAAGMRFTYKAHASERPFMDEYPQMGKVHPSTGYIKVIKDGKTVFEADIRTDLEKIWDSYQAEILPAVKQWCEEKYPDISPENQPFFAQLKMEISVSEPDYRLESREDIISSLDALHEDMYFLGGDYFKNYGSEKCGAMFDAPGLILPVIHNSKGTPRFTATLYENTADKPYLEADGKIVAQPLNRNDISLYISRISYENGLVFDITAQGVEESVLASYADLIGKNIIHKGTRKMNFIADSSNIHTALSQRETVKKCKTIEDIDIHEGQLFSYEMYIDLMSDLKQVDGIEVFETATSAVYGGKVYAVWLSPKYEGYLSMTKRLTRLPSEIINSRHHANEVSSTNSAFMLIKKLLTDEKYADIADKMNLVIVPLENTEGTMLHDELQSEHPNWKLHIARFNGSGMEFYRQHFDINTPHTEAMGLTRLYEKFIPDILVDNHGVPSHEWDQQFSGYTSPSYKGFWLPRSLLYGYFWYVTNEEYKDNYAVNKRMEDVIADKIGSIAEMAELNKEWSKQFEKYAHAWMPKLFPADYYKDMIDYWIPFAFDSNHRYASIRFPWLTTVAYTSEVADETAQGEYLDLCARAHLAHDEATLDMIMNANHVYDKHIDSENMVARYLRHRPMKV